jgi:hypothetical protein
MLPPLPPLSPFVVFVVLPPPPAPPAVPPHTHSVHSPSRHSRVPWQPLGPEHSALSSSWQNSGVLLVDFEEHAPTIPSNSNVAPIKAWTLEDRREDIEPQSIELRQRSQSSNPALPQRITVNVSDKHHIDFLTARPRRQHIHTKRSCAAARSCPDLGLLEHGFR